MRSLCPDAAKRRSDTSLPTLCDTQERPPLQPSLDLDTIVVQLALVIRKARRRPDNQTEEIIQAERCRNLAMILVAPSDRDRRGGLRPAAHCIGDRNVRSVTV